MSSARPALAARGYLGQCAFIATHTDEVLRSEVEENLGLAEGTSTAEAAAARNAFTKARLRLAVRWAGRKGQMKGQSGHTALSVTCSRKGALRRRAAHHCAAAGCLFMCGLGSDVLLCPLLLPRRSGSDASSGQGLTSRWQYRTERRAQEHMQMLPLPLPRPWPNGRASYQWRRRR